GGANSTATVHLPFGASTWPEHPSLEIVNEPGSGAPSAAVSSVTDTVFEFDVELALLPRLDSLIRAGVRAGDHEWRRRGHRSDHRRSRALVGERHFLGLAGSGRIDAAEADRRRGGAQ